MAQITAPEKAAFISLVQGAGNPIEAARLQDILFTYSDIVTAVYRQLLVFAGNNEYLTQAMAVFAANDTELLAAGIWNNKTMSSPPVTDPVLIVNSTINDDVFMTLQSPNVPRNLGILGTTTIKRIYLEPSVNIFQLYIGPGVVVDKVDSSQPGALINTIYLPNIKNNPPKLNIIQFGSAVNQIIQDPPGAYYGGVSNDDPQNTCGANISDFKYANILHNTIQLTWTPPNLQSPPADYLFINTYYRVSGTNPWILADKNIGVFNGDSGFTFLHLKPDTSYDFQVWTTCANGGISMSAILTVQTTAVQ